MRLTQSQKVFNYLKRNRIATTNELRSALHIVDVPKAVSILTKKGFNISARRLPDATAEYTYGEKRPTRRIEYVGGVARIIEL